MNREMGRLFVLLALKHSTTVHGRRCEKFDLDHHDEADPDRLVLSCATCGVVLHRVPYREGKPPDAQANPARAA